MIKNNLNIRTDFSLGESLMQIDKMIERSKALGYESLTLTDTMSVHGLVSFSVKAKKEGIKANIGCRLRVVDDPTYRKPTKSSGLSEKKNPLFMPKVYALNDTGIQSIFKLLTKGTSPDYFYYHSRVGIEDLALSGIAISTGDFFNLFHMPDYEEKLKKMILAVGPENVYVELVPINTPLFDTLNARAVSAAKKYGLQTISTYPSLYLEKDDAMALEVLQAITTNTQWDAGWRPQQFVKDFYLEKPERLTTLVSEAYERQVKWHGLNEKWAWDESLKANSKLDDRMTFEYKNLPVSLPKMASDEFMTLGRKCIDGWKSRLTKKVLGYQPDVKDLPKYKQRLEYELGVLMRMGFSGYFLLVEDLVMWSKKSSIMVGPGRGSIGGSLVAFLLGITDIDPLRFNLMFERFINPSRLDLPDADLDFMSSRRLEVVDYLRDKYGVDRVAGISNYSTLGAASALRDSGRIFGLSGLQMMATKLVPKEHGQSANLQEASEAVPEIAQFKSDYPKVWENAIKLEGAMRAFGQHAAGCVIAGEPIVNRAVLETRGGTPVVNWDKRVVEDLGLIKMDLLGLSTLDTLSIAAEYIKENHGIDIDYTEIPLNDPKVMKSFSEGATKGVFQFESGGMVKLLRDLASGGELTFDNISAATALYRPGPMDSGMMDDYIAAKKGVIEPHYPHKCTIPVLSETYGVSVYQEQVMKVAVTMCGFSNTEADTLRKAIGKKDLDKMKTMGEKYINGASAGFIDVELEDGSKIVVHRSRRFKCADGEERTIEEAMNCNADIVEDIDDEKF